MNSNELIEIDNIETDAILEEKENLEDQDQEVELSTTIEATSDALVSGNSLYYSYLQNTMSFDANL